MSESKEDKGSGPRHEDESPAETALPSRGIPGTGQGFAEGGGERALLESIMRAAPLAIGKVDPDRVLLEVNEYMCRMLGYAREELVGHSALILHPSREDFEFVGRDKYARIAEAGVGSVETRWRRKDGTIPDLGRHPHAVSDPMVGRYALKSCIFYPVVVEGRTVGCLGCFDDRPRQWTEEEVEIAGMLAQALSVEQERLDREEQLKDFIDVASHELRHPITVIKGYAQTLREFWGKLSPARREELLAAVEHGADRLERLVKELLDVSRIERGYFPLRREEVEVNDLLSGAAEELANRGYPNRVNVVLQEGAEKVKADRDRLSLLLSILLDNATKYSPPGSVIDLEVREVEDGVLFSVMDRGIGVPEEEREKVFDRFYQVEDALHHSTPGMGIGLYIAREIDEAHGGRIWCEAREGGGTVFRFLIPQGG